MMSPRNLVNCVNKGNKCMLLLDSFVVSERMHPEPGHSWRSCKLSKSGLFPPSQVKEGPPIWRPRPVLQVKHFLPVSPNQ